MIKWSQSTRRCGGSSNAPRFIDERRWFRMKRPVIWPALAVVLGLAPSALAQTAPPPLPFEPSAPPPASPPSPSPSPSPAPAPSLSPSPSPSSSPPPSAEAPSETDDSTTTKRPALGLSPDSPQVGALPGGVMPAFGSIPTGDQDWRFDFHGLATLPLRAGINTRANPAEEQHKTVLHAPPGVPGDFG